MIGGLKCPYCEEELDIDHEDCYDYNEDVKYQMECECCGQNFVFTISISIFTSPEKADCLNDGNHIFQLVATWPKEFSRMKCSSCDETRELTESEQVKFKIGTKESYFDKIEKLDNK